MKAYRVWNKVTREIYWVAQIAGHTGRDWGYTTHASQAIELSDYWQARFAADCRYVGSEAHFIYHND
jgi:hypothetical protein